MIMNRIDTVQRCRRELVGGWSRNLEVLAKVGLTAMLSRTALFKLKSVGSVAMLRILQVMLMMMAMLMMLVMLMVQLL